MNRKFFLLLLLVFPAFIGYAQDDAKKGEAGKENVISVTPNLMVREMQMAILFYTEKLGFHVVSQVPENGVPTWAMLSSGNAVIMLQQEESLRQAIEPLRTREPGGGFTLYLKVNNIDELYNNVAHQCEFWTEIRETEYRTAEFTILDPMGYFITIAQDR
jgi:uncharacterized glyoxalase superfamily protein PhnB